MPDFASLAACPVRNSTLIVVEGWVIEPSICGPIRTPCSRTTAKPSTLTSEVSHSMVAHRSSMSYLGSSGTLSSKSASRRSANSSSVLSRFESSRASTIRSRSLRPHTSGSSQESSMASQIPSPSKSDGTDVLSWGSVPQSHSYELL